MLCLRVVCSFDVLPRHISGRKCVFFEGQICRNVNIHDSVVPLKQRFIWLFLARVVPNANKSWAYLNKIRETNEPREFCEILLWFFASVHNNEHVNIYII